MKFFIGVKRKYFLEPTGRIHRTFCAREDFGGNDDNDIMISSDHAKGL